MKPTGCTAQFITIAISLRIALVEYFARAEIIDKNSSIEGNEELGARQLTIVLLTASLLESCINAALAVSLSPPEFKKIERRPTRAKWFDYSKRVNSSFILEEDSPIGREFRFIFDCRDSIVHARPEVHSDNLTIHYGNHAPWGLLKHERILPIVTASLSLIEELSSGCEPLVAGIGPSVAWQLRLSDF